MIRVFLERVKKSKAFFSINKSFVFFGVAALFLYLTNQFYMLGQINKLLEITNSTVMLASVLTVMVIPRLIILPLAGILTDKYNERTIMLFGFIGLTILMGSMGIIEQMDLLSLKVLMIYAGVFGGISAVILPSTFSIIPKIINQNNLPKANAAIQLINQLTIFIGPAIAGILLGFMQLKYYYVIISVMMFLSVILIYFCKFRLLDHETENLEQVEKQPQPDKGIKGYKVIFSTPILILLLLFTAVLNLGVAGPQQIGLPILIDKELKLGTTELGYLLSVLGLGSIVGSVLIGFFSKRMNLLFSLSLLGIVFSLLWSFIVRPDHFILISVLLGLAGIAIGSINVIFITLLQLHSPQEILGKVMSIQLMGSVGLQPLSFLISGILIDNYGLQTAFLLGGCSIFAVSLILLFMFVKGKKEINKKKKGKMLTNFSEQC
jgi:MFS family permease